MHIQPYLFFDGRCEEAIQFYQKAIGAEVTFIMRVKESPEPHQPGALPPGSEDKVMHAAFRIGETLLLASDGRNQGKPHFEGFSLSLTAADDAEAKRWFAALSSGGSVTQPLIKTFFSSSFGMLSDRFGVPWMIVVDSGDPRK